MAFEKQFTCMYVGMYIFMYVCIYLVHVPPYAVWRKRLQKRRIVSYDMSLIFLLLSVWLSKQVALIGCLFLLHKNMVIVLVLMLAVN